jgi:hypothetical protein
MKLLKNHKINTLKEILVQMKQIKWQCWSLFKYLFSKINIFYEFSNELSKNVFEKHKSSTNSNMLTHDFPIQIPFIV